jgi:GNAT superfamily N-acetyltransferase
MAAKLALIDSSRMKLEIRELGPGDLDALLNVYGHLHERDDPLPAREVVRAEWERTCADPAQVYLGGFREGELVSACNAAIVPNFTRGLRPWAAIENVVTRADLRGHGVGSQVIQALLERCWGAGCYKVMLQSGAGRDAAHRFYEANGFDRTAKQAFIIRR